MLAKSARLCSTSYSRYARIFAGALSPVSNSGLYWLFFCYIPQYPASRCAWEFLVSSSKGLSQSLTIKGTRTLELTSKTFTAVSPINSG